MEQAMYYIFCAMTLVGALGVLMLREYVNAAMSMLVSMLGVAGLLILMQAYFLAFIMVSVYAGAVLVLFVFVVMLLGDKLDDSALYKKIALLVLWILAGGVFALFEGDLSKYANNAEVVQTSLPFAKNYGYELYKQFMLPVQVSGALLLAAMVGVMVIAKPKTHAFFKKDSQQ